MTDHQEEWRVCPDNDNYQVSNLGRVRRATFSQNRKSKPGDIITPTAAKNGYLFVGLWRDGKMIRRSVHRLVAIAFLGMPPTVSHEVAHCDGCRSNNMDSNLRWATRRENHADKVAHGTAEVGERNGNSKLTTEQVRKILSYPANANRSKLAREFGVSQVTVTRIMRREMWKHVDLEEIV